MVDREHLAYIIKEINESKGTPYQIANEELADEIFPYLKKEFPDIQMVKYDVYQWFVVTKRAGNTLKKQLEEMILNHNYSISELKKTINKLN